MFDAFKRLHIFLQMFFLFFAVSFLLLIFGGLISESGGGRADAEPLKNNVSDKRIYLKELTTGDNILDKSFPVLSFNSIEFVSFYYNYFGEMENINAYINTDKRVVRYEILTWNNLKALQQAIEEKLTTENNRSVFFLCSTITENVPPLKWNIRSCEVKSGQQVLTLTEYSLMTKRPSDVSVLEWSAIKRPNIISLSENLALSNETLNNLKAEKERQNMLETEKAAKAHKDV